MAGAEQEKTESTSMTAMAAGRRKRTTEELPVIRKYNVAGGEYPVGGIGVHESADESDEWIGEETKKSASEEEAETAGGGGEARRLLTVTSGESEGSGVEYKPGGAAVGGCATSDATPEDAETSGTGGRH